jgi:PAS domain S-box-containing protein
VSHSFAEAQPPLSERLPIVTYTNAFGEPVETLWMSPQVERLFGYSAADWVGTPGFFERVLHPDDRAPVLAEARALRDELRPFSRDYRLVRPNGDVVWVHDESVAIVDDAGEPRFIQGYFVDITERKRLEEALQHAQKVEAVGRLAGGIAHDFNNLLTAIAGYAEVAYRHLADDHPARRPVKEIAGTVQRCVRLTRQLLAFSRRQSLEPEHVDLAHVVQAMESMLLHVAGNGVQVDFDLCDSASVCADVGQLEQVLLNLVANARDAMPDGGRVSIRTARVTIERGAESVRLDLPPGEYVGLVVADTGAGMPPETQARVFDPFFTTKERGAGTGLGLSTVQGIVRQSGGAVDVTSGVGVGTTFRILLPVASVG